MFSSFNLTEESHYPTPVANSPWLPFLLLSLMSQKHSPNIARDFRFEYDYIVVGGGSAGSVVASRLSEIPCASVLLLEAGKTPPFLTEVPAFKPYFLNTDIDWKYMTEPQKFTGAYLRNRQVMWSSAKVLGGSSIHNDMLMVRGNRKTYDSWAQMGATGWSYSDVLPYFRKLENSSQLEDIEEEFHGFNGPITVSRPPYYSELNSAVVSSALRKGIPLVDVNGRRSAGVVDILMNMRDGQRCSPVKGYLVPSENQDNLDILTEAFVAKIILNGNTATGVTFEYKGRLYTVEANREVIISAGAVRSPQLLMLSGIGPRHHLESLGIPVVANLPVGYNLHDHVGSLLLYELSNDIVPLEEKLGDARYIDEYIQHRTGPLIGSLAIVYWYKNMYRIWKEAPDYNAIFLEFKAKAMEGMLTEEAYDRIYRPYENKTLFACVSQNLHAKSRGRLWLRSRDPHDHPHIDPRYMEVEEDVMDVAAGLKFCNSIAESPELRSIGAKPISTPFPGCEDEVDDDDRYYSCIARAICLPTYHYSGTNRMGSVYDQHTVVDPNLRVKGINGLRVVDASVIPVVPAGNTNIPVIMIAEKITDTIKNDQWSC